MAADDEAALRGIALRWPACGAPGAAGRPAKLPCGEHPRKKPRSPSRVPGRCIAAGTGVAHPLFLIPLPQRGRGSRRGGRRLPRTTGTHRGPAALRSRWPACGPRPPHSGRGARGACRERSRRNRARSLRLHSPIVSFAFGSGWPQRPTRFARDDQQRKRHRFARYDEMSPSPLSYGLAMGRECR